MNRKALVAVRQLQEQRTLFKVTLDILGIRDLAFLIEDYAMRCEGHQLVSKIPLNSHSYDTRHAVFIYFTGQKGVHTFRGFTVGGEELECFPFDHQFPTGEYATIQYVTLDHVSWFNYKLKKLFWMTRDGVIHTLDHLPSGMVIFSVNQNGVWLVQSNQNLVAFQPFNGSALVTHIIPTIKSHQTKEVSCLDHLTLLVTFTTLLRTTEYWMVTFCATSQQLEERQLNVRVPFDTFFIQFLMDGSHIYCDESNENTLVSQNFWVPEDFEQCQNGLVYRDFGKRVEWFIDPIRGFLFVEDNGNTVVYY
jgi:hypothetical protein